jgi:hypothetical protein
MLDRGLGAWKGYKLLWLVAQGGKNRGLPSDRKICWALIRGHDLWHFQHWLTRKVVVHIIDVFLNLQLGWPVLDLDGLLAL